MQVVVAQPIKSEVDDAQLDAIVGRLSVAQAQLMFNHGSAGDLRETDP